VETISSSLAEFGLDCQLPPILLALSLCSGRAAGRAANISRNYKQSQGPGGQALLPSQLVQFLSPFYSALSGETHSVFPRPVADQTSDTELGRAFRLVQGSDPAQTVPAQPQYGLAATSFCRRESGGLKTSTPGLVRLRSVWQWQTALKVSISRGVITEGLTAGMMFLSNPANDLPAAQPEMEDYRNIQSRWIGADFTTPLGSGGAKCIAQPESIAIALQYCGFSTASLPT